MNHEDICDDDYCKIWNECYSEILFIPSQNRYTRSSMASSKDKLESLEIKLQVNGVV